MSLCLHALAVPAASVSFDVHDDWCVLLMSLCLHALAVPAASVSFDVHDDGYVLLMSRPPRG